jgi:ribokinase
MSKEPRVVVVGSHVQGLFMRVEHLPTPDETVLGWDYREALDGGKGSHQAIACGRLGMPTSFVGRVGQDHFGDRGAGWMRDAGVDLTYLKRSQDIPTGTGFIIINHEGVPLITTAMGANGDFSPTDVDDAEELIARSTFMVITFEIPVKTALHASRLGRKHGLTVILTPGPAEPLTPDALSAVDILVPNASEARILMGMDPDAEASAEDLARGLQARFGLENVVITLGETGAAVSEGEKLYLVSAIKVDVIDTPGAGDAFTAGMTKGLFEGKTLAEAVQFGCITGGYAVTVRESVPAFPTLEQLREFVKRYNLQVPEGIL